MTDFGGRYRRVKLLGQGGMGEVWLAFDMELDDRPVAIKIIRSDMLADQDGPRRFQQEMRLASKMHHPNIMTVLTSGTDHGIPFMVLEYLEGHDLRKVPLGWDAGEVPGSGGRLARRSPTLMALVWSTATSRRAMCSYVTPDW